MASFRVNWVPMVLALLGCALISTVASDQTLSEELISKLKNDSLTPVETEELLLSYKSKEIKIYDRPVADWTELCELSLDKCYISEQHRVMRLILNYAVRDIPKLMDYGRYCVEEKIKNYCAANVDKVARLLLEGASDEDKKLVRSFLMILAGGKNLDSVSSGDIRMGYIRLKDASIGAGASEDDEKEFRDKFYRALKYFSKIDYFLPYLLRLRDKNGSLPVPHKKIELTTENDILISEWYNVGQIANNFVQSISSTKSTGPQSHKQSY